MSIKDFKRVVLLCEVLKFLNIISDGIYIDATFGQGGHSEGILSYLSKQGRLFAIDRDYAAVRIGKIIAKRDHRVTVIHGQFSKLFQYMKTHNLIGKVNGILFDLGVSRLQLEDNNRGFSFKNNGLLDMRMDTNSSLSASLWLRTASLKRIVWVLTTFGEERFAKRIANAIVTYRKHKNLIYTHELVKLITSSVPYYDKHKHPATRTFQAIRMYINNELSEIQDVLQAALLVLAPGGRLLVISFHSLEDRIVKYFIRAHSLPSLILNKSNSDIQYNDTFEKKFFTNSNNNQYKYYLKFIKRVFPSKSEIQYNISARSAVLRCAEKVVI
ncbi:16S rRNA (cytosine(1402)-N(4))-methyltransferase RsmH [Blochmannia endosymbiont of Polyrhachis (Hedomyrma) turneri]|uniref:16S rRNA (cytosine(1402)-N(4))-methyltransferase RsmH n=1 Tax=Blochmannia endosymbiont of Polyrhachis (Hedomyrma) turneri TaxID=1505596 RepID=UPI00061A7854|nr:16S rRNA (cytosine(1402)-N(4))-methyltransferase RsmH [Blochmannia endosymbiont of Polyrhachis (Hedomyrma) turneri]AKC59717.1 Ribosomal RNA small subunit methyltransferase H [Blochmannia endosymbiont of Polyrhachis (Hedomyrma) turneri]